MLCPISSKSIPTTGKSMSGNLMFPAGDHLDLAHTAHASLFSAGVPAWKALASISSYLDAHLKPGVRGTVHPRAEIGGWVFIDEGTVVEPGAFIKGPAWIG